MVNPEIKEVYIPACAEHEGRHGVKVKLRWVCPVCGKPRGEIKNVRSYDGSLILFCDGWSNDCGHVDKYDDVIAEAKANGLNNPAPPAQNPLKVVKCKSCGAQITWIVTQNGRSMPCDFPAVKYQENRKGKSQIVTSDGRVVRADVITDDNKQTSLLEKIVDGEGYISHFATCPYADQHRRK